MTRAGGLLYEDSFAKIIFSIRHSKYILEAGKWWRYAEAELKKLVDNPMLVHDVGYQPTRGKKASVGRPVGFLRGRSTLSAQSICAESQG
jgi:hypothetical protein